MTRAKSTLAVVSLCLAAGLIGGCAGGKEFQTGWQAERRKQFHVAYEYYCKAAEKSPSNRVISGAIARVAAKAARHWEDQAHAAVKAGRYDEAWRFFMRALEIRPDHPSAAHLIRQLEREHPQEVTVAKHEWLRGVPASIARAEQPAEPAAPSSNAQPPATQPTPPTEPLAYAGPDKRAPELPRRPSTGPGAPSHPRQAAPTGPGPASRPARAFIVVHTISRDDHRYQKIIEAIDGLFVKVKDTDPRPLDADLEVYLGTKQISKFKDLQVGNVRVVTGRSGRWYKLVVLKILDDKETVQFGIRQAE